METIVVVNRTTDWPGELPDVEVVQASEYLTAERWTGAVGVRVFNLCRSYRYQSTGYYVSLLATARRHRPFPGLMTLLDMKSRALVRSTGEELDELIQKALGPIRSRRFTLSIYFGRNLTRRYDRLAQRLFEAHPAPMLRAEFVRGETWRLTSLAPIPAREIPANHTEFVMESAGKYFERPRYRARRARHSRFDLAILHDPKEEFSPSDPRALKRFKAAAEKQGFSVEFVLKDDYARIPEFDALFLRETTYVDHHTFRFSQRAAAEGLVVIDDPESILRCTNKVYMAETFALRRIRAPRTLVVDAAGIEAAAARVGFPCVLKYPDSSFSQGVLRCTDSSDFEAKAQLALASSDLLLVQEFLPSAFDWRIGIIDGTPLYACRYNMAKGHWQIIDRSDKGELSYGRTETLPVEDAPGFVVRTALRAAKAIGDGLYGVDLKEIDGKAYVIEINDNPSIDRGHEDAVLGDELYERIMAVFLQRVERSKQVTSR